ncbi:MAG TPA: hypothetical protein VLF43_02765, partial [Candidatus Saccharimonadales bacterium]|nr:hypothetical protein [Candidatus Saccharimonadales bacterium]
PHMRRLQISYNLVRLRIAGSGSGAQVVRRFSDYTSVAGQDVMLFDGVVRSGNTIQMLEARMTNEQTEPLPASIAVAALVDKPAARSKVGRHVKVHYAGFAVPQDTYLVGVGLDHEGIGRELPHIYRDIDPNLAEEPRYELPEFNGGQAWRRP